MGCQECGDSSTWMSNSTIAKTANLQGTASVKSRPSRFFDERPPDLSEVVKQKKNFVTFFALEVAVNRKIFEVVDNCEIPESAKRFPLLRAAGPVNRQGKVHDWCLWDGEREWSRKTYARPLRLPITFCNCDTLLIERH